MELIPGVRGVVLDDPTEDDITTAYAVAYETERQLGYVDLTRGRIANEMTGPESLPGSAMLGYQGDAAVALLTMECEPTGRELFVSTYVTVQPQRPLLDALVTRAITLARQRAALDPCPPPAAGVDPFVPSPDHWQLMAGMFDNEPEYRDVLEAHGFGVIRRFWRMRWDVTGRSPDEPAAPPGVTKRVVSGEDDSRLFHRLFTESFAEHFGSSHDQPYEQWIAAIRGLDGRDPDRCWIVELDGEPVGMCIVDDSRAELGTGHVRTLGVLQSARGRGIGRWLLECAGADAVRRGLGGVTLGVDSGNESGATELYESVGFEVARVILAACYPLLDADASASSR